MSSAAATAEAPAAKKGSKKLIIIIVAVLLLVVVGGGAAVVLMKQKAAAAAAAEAEDEEGGDADEAPSKDAAPASKRDPKHPPTFVPLEPFVVNLADKESDRFAQIGVTLEVEDAKFADELKLYMPAIRNGILMVLAHKTSAQLLSQEGKVALAKEIKRESMLPLGIEIDAEDDEHDEDAPKKKRKKKKAAVHSPVSAVHFSNFIVQ